jgi:hypothetical protein
MALWTVWGLAQPPGFASRRDLPGAEKIADISGLSAGGGADGKKMWAEIAK